MTATKDAGLPARETVRQAYARLSSAQKGTKGAPAYSRFVNRRVGRVLAAVAYRIGLTPNQVTAISATWTFAAIALLALVQPAWWLGLTVTALLLVGYAFDSADGQLARLRGGGSLSGEWLDHMVDAAKTSTLHLALLIGLYRFDVVSAAWLLVPLGYSAVWSVMFFAIILNDQMRERAGATTRAAAGGGRQSVLRSLLVAPTDYGVLCLSFALYGATTVFFVAYTALFVATGAFLAAACVAWYREIARLARPTAAPTAVLP
jgi:phosphatidylglycerophosphate synthase